MTDQSIPSMGATSGITLSSQKTLARCAILLTNRTHERQLEEEVSERIRMGGLIGRSPPMRKLFHNILRAATSEATVLIEGEGGTGKELVARALHENSNRSKGPYVRLHCAAPDALQALENYDWPGNIRELTNILEFAIVQSDSPHILPSHFPPEIHNQVTVPAYQAAGTEMARNMQMAYYRTRMQPDEEKDMIFRILKETGGNKAAAARRLGMSRTTLWKRLKHFDMA